MKLKLYFWIKRKDHLFDLFHTFKQCRFWCDVPLGSSVIRAELKEKYRWASADEALYRRSCPVQTACRCICLIECPQPCYLV